MIALDYPDIRETIKNHLVAGRTESASFLIWYLENYYRLEDLHAVDSVCDQKGDKGIDGIYVSEGENTIDVFQSKITQNINSTIGDTSLKEFYGTLSQFKSKATLANLLSTTKNTQVASLAERIDLLTKIESYNVRGFFLSNTTIDANGLAYLKVVDNIKFIGKNELNDTYISDSRKLPKGTDATFDVSGYTISKYVVDEKTNSIIAPVMAKELVKLTGISNQSLFAFNVRGPLGRTNVNKDIVKSIKDKKIHKFFPLFHNGITMICRQLKQKNERIRIKDYFVVNGCQSLSELYFNKEELTDELRILTKFIQVDVDSELSEIITKYSNNQNGVKPRDFKSNNKIQIRLQNEITEKYPEFFYEIKRGEVTDGKTVISNESVGLYLMAFDLKEPWNAPRKYQIFEDKYAVLFGRPEVNCSRIVMLHILMECVNSNITQINNKLFGKYNLTGYLMLCMLRLILEKNTLGNNLVSNPEPFVKSPDLRDKLIGCIQNIIDDVLVDLNAEIDPLGEDFDYRNKLRDQTWVNNLTKLVVSNYEKLVKRKRINSFSMDWQT